MGLEIEDVVDGGMGGEESLSGSSGLEFLLLSLPSPDRQMRIFRPIVLPHPARLVALCQAQIPGRGAVRSKLVGDDRLGMDAVVPKQFPQQLQRRRLVATFLDQHVQDLALVVDGAP